MVVTEPGGWAVLKLFPAWQHESEPRFAAEGGHLYRRGHFGWLSEAGIVSHPEAKHVYKRGETRDNDVATQCRAGHRERTSARRRGR